MSGVAVVMGHKPLAAARRAASAWALLALPALAVAQAQAPVPVLLQPDEFISLIDEQPATADIPLMQVPIEQGTQTLIGPPGNAPRVPPAAGSAGDGGLADAKATRALCDAVVADLAAAQVGSAFERLAPHWPLPHQEIGRLAGETEAQLQQLTQKFGALAGHEWVRSRSGGQSLVQHLYLIKLEAHGLRLACTFYRPHAHWQVHTVFWDDQIDSLLEP